MIEWRTNWSTDSWYSLCDKKSVSFGVFNVMGRNGDKCYGVEFSHADKADEQRLIEKAKHIILEVIA